MTETIPTMVFCEPDREDVSAAGDTMHTRFLTLLLTTPLCGQSLASLPVEPDGERTAANRTDWLIDATPFKAGVFRSADGKELVLRNGLVRRALRLSPNAATVAVDNLASGQSMLRGVKPEARVELDGQRFAVGGLNGQPDYAFMAEEWVDRLTRNPRAFRLESFRVVWFRKYRAILESDIIHGSSRRADGRDLDWLLHANPKLATKGMLVVYNPLNHEVERTIERGLYYTGLQRHATLTGAEDGETGYDLDRKSRIRVHVKVAAGAMRRFAITGD